MIKELPFFPLNLVAFPGEDLNLHVFEPRYKELINECLEASSTFGIPAYIHNKLEMGTEMEIVELVRTYSDGRMDIRTRGLAVFKVIDFENPVTDKLYSGGKVEILPIDLDIDMKKIAIIKNLLTTFYRILKVDNPFESDRFQYSFDFAHKIGLSLDEEYQLLQMPGEQERLDFVIAHINKTIPTVTEVEKTRERIALNGHFKRLGPLEF